MWLLAYGYLSFCLTSCNFDFLMNRIKFVSRETSFCQFSNMASSGLKSCLFLRKSKLHNVASCYLESPHSHKCFDPWNVEYKLSLFGSWALASPLTTFKPAWKTAILLALFNVKHCSDLTLLCIDNLYLFLQHVHSHIWWQDRLTGSSSSSDLH